MRTLKKPAKGTGSLKPKTSRTMGKSANRGAVDNIRKLSDAWAQRWNAGELDRIVDVYAKDAVYLPPQHPALHGRDSIREYLRGPLSHGVSGLAFDITYIKRQGPVAWDVGKYRMDVPQSDGTRKQDRGKYLTVWRRTGTEWLIVADAWSSDLPLLP